MSPLRRGADTPPITIDVGTGYEMLMSLVTYAETSNRAVVEVGPDWLAAAEKRAGADLIERVAEFSQGSGEAYIQLLALVYDAPAPRDADTFLDHLATIDAAELVRVLLGYYDYHMRRMTPPDTISAAVDGDEEAVTSAVACCEAWPEWQPFVERLLRLGHDRAKEELLGLLRDWTDRVWRPEEDKLLPILRRDAEQKRLLARELPFERFVEVATNGVQYVGRPDVDRLVLVPSYVNRPWVSHAEWHGAMIMIYPVADETVAAESDAPPLRLVRLTKALADEKRLRILRVLAERPRSLMELAEQFEVPKTSMHHHMVTLRSAGLVSVATGNKDKVYRLRNDVLPGMTAMLAGYIASPDVAGAPKAQGAPAVLQPLLARGRRLTAARTPAPAGRPRARRIDG